ncbi:MAG TPA: CDP-archaeol synthase [Acetobacteraceae bacterium]|jgi:CDP-diglyceride synthetase|nr:CDP-archaeol synthase [Acetobacteraceae bacterium]
MHPIAVAQILGLITLANSVPVVAKNILGDRSAWPLDFGIVLRDGHRLFGASKTIRGVLLGVFACLLVAPLIGVDPWIGAMVGALSMAGDLLSSFIKRRMGRPPSSQALGLDQIPESLFPLLAGIGPLGLTLTDILVGTVIFTVGELLLSRLLFRFHLRDRPY